jgi:hypothetical protein
LGRTADPVQLPHPHAADAKLWRCAARKGGAPGTWRLLDLNDLTITRDPYRDRAQHLAQFIPHVVTYFERDKLDRQIAVTINIVEQAGNAPFSRGRLANCGFLLTRDTSDYVCIHDVDYLPMWAD